MAPKSKPEAAPEATPSVEPTAAVTPEVTPEAPKAPEPGVRFYTLKDGSPVKETTKANGIVVTSYLGKEG